MKKRKRVSPKGKVAGYTEPEAPQAPGQPGVRLEALCEEREVGINGVIHWNDTHLEVTDIYNLTGWFELESFHIDKKTATPDHTIVNARSYEKIDPLQFLSKTVKADEEYLSSGNIYQETGSFRYDEPGNDGRGVSELNFSFNDITNLGFAVNVLRY